MTHALLADGDETAFATLALAHGAGQGMDSPFMDAFGAGLAARGLRVLRFEFPYMAGRRVDGRKRGPDREPVLLETWRQVVAQVAGEGMTEQRLLIGGKSLGGRMASMVADELGVAGLICLGYPFHPPGKPERLRTTHLTKLRTPTLICQGTRDPFGTREEAESYPLSPAIRLFHVEDGEHSFKPRKSSGRTEAQNWQAAMDAVAEFASHLAGN